MCLFGVLGIAMWETQIRLELKASSRETMEVGVFKEGREDFHTLFEEKVLSVGMARVTLIYV